MKTFGPKRKPAPIGEQFNRLIVKEEISSRRITKGWERLVICHCLDCGRDRIIPLRLILHGKYKSCGQCFRNKNMVEYTSQVDGSVYLGCVNNDYIKVKDGKKRIEFHVLEARKVYTMLGLNFPGKGIVHHINNNKLDNDIGNLAVIESCGAHTKHHQDMGQAMYQFLVRENLLDKFLMEHPEFHLISLKDMLNKSRKVV